MSLELEPQGDTQITDTGTADGASADGTSQTPSPVQLAEDALVSVKVNGQDQTLPWKEARQGVMFHKTFTEKTMALARERENYERQNAAIAEREQQVNERLEQIQAIFSDPQRVQQLAFALMQRQQAAPAGPRALTDQDLPKLQQSQQEAMRAEMEEFKQNFATQQVAARIEQDIDIYTKGILAKYPEVAAVNGIENAIYGQVKDLGPSSPEEAKEHVRVMIEQINTNLNKAWEDKVKRQALEKSQAVRGIEPKGGSPVWPKVPEVKKLADLDQAFIDYLQQGARS